MNRDDIQKLAELSRLSLTDAQVDEYQKDFEGILGHINTLKDVNITNLEPERQVNTNVMRDDQDAYAPGQFTQDLLSAAPERDADFVKVQKIL